MRKMIMFNACKRIKRPLNDFGNLGKLGVFKGSLEFRNLDNRLVFVPKIEIPHRRHEVLGWILGGLESVESKTIGNFMGLGEAKPKKVDVKGNKCFAIVFNHTQEGPPRSQHFVAASRAWRVICSPQEG